MRAIVTVTAKDQVGIIANVANTLSALQINVLDLSQTILQEYFVMIMLTDISKCTISFAELNEHLRESGEELGLDIRIQREDIFNAMHRI